MKNRGRENGWIVLLEGEHGKENGSIIGEGKDVKIRGEGEGEVVKLVGEIEGDVEGILWGNDVGLRLEGMKMKEIEGDCMEWRICEYEWNRDCKNRRRRRK